ncbi:MAG: type I restriction endonuclease, partial [Nitrospinales bacterium]
MNQGAFTEDVVEQAALAWFENLGYGLIHGPDIAPEGKAQERASYADVILEEKLRSVLATINPNIPADVLDDVYRKVSSSSAPDLIEDNKNFHRMLVDGVDVEYSRNDGSIAGDKVWLIDFENAEKNTFSAINQFTVFENKHNRRPDIVVFVNGIPFAVVELKNAVNENTTIGHAYNQLQTYKKEIPSLFRTNALLVISDGIRARAGSLTANKERFMPWRTVDGVSIAPKGSAELETLLKGVFEKNIF